MDQMTRSLLTAKIALTTGIGGTLAEALIDEAVEQARMMNTTKPLRGEELEPMPASMRENIEQEKLIAQYAAAFTEWETAWRLNPTEFLTEKEVRAMNVGDAGQRSAIYFNALMRKVAV